MNKEELQRQIDNMKVQLYDIIEMQMNLSKQFDQLELNRRQFLQQLNNAKLQLANFKEEPK